MESRHLGGGRNKLRPSRYHFGRAHEEVHPHPVCVGKRRGTAALLHRASVVLYATTSYFIIGLDLVFQRF